jgi:hypothetical protein
MSFQQARPKAGYLLRQPTAAKGFIGNRGLRQGLKRRADRSGEPLRQPYNI